VPRSLHASNFETLVSFDVRPKVSPKFLDALTHPFGVALNLRDVEYQTRCFQSFKFHFVDFSLNRWNSSCRMPDTNNLTHLPIVIKSIHNPKRTKDDLAKTLVFVFRNDAAQLGKALKPVSLGNQLISERHGALGIIARNENHYVVEVIAGSGRPDQLVSHEAN